MIYRIVRALLVLGAGLLLGMALTGVYLGVVSMYQMIELLQDLQ